MDEQTQCTQKNPDFNLIQLIIKSEEKENDPRGGGEGRILFESQTEVTEKLNPNSG